MAATRESFFLALFLLSSYLFIGLCPSGGTDTIRQGEPLMDWMNLTSPNHDFTLRFFSPRKSRNRYLGILHNRGQPVWIANRDVPITDASGNLRIDADGKFQIYYAGGALMILFDAAVATNASATLLDSGNLVLLNLNGSILWQSFNYPTDTLLSGMRIGINLKTGQKWRLASWTTDDIPSPGSFTLELDDLNGNDTSQLVIMWRGIISWKSGPLQEGHFQNTNDYMFQNNSEVSFNYTSNEAEKYFTCYAKNNGPRAETRYPFPFSPEIPYPFSKKTSFPLTLTSEGYLKSDGIYMVLGCDSYRNRNQWLQQGCVQQAMPNCRTPNHYFEQRKGSIYSHKSYQYDEGHNLNAIDCQQMCWDNCTCSAYASLNLNGTGCEFYDRTYKYSTSDGNTPARDVYILRQENEKGHRRWRIWVIAGTVSLFILLLCLCFCLVRRKIHERDRDQFLEVKNHARQMAEINSNSGAPRN